MKPYLATLIPDPQLRQKIHRCVNGVHTRCYNPRRSDYPYYGGRGIRVDFPTRRAFIEYIITLPGWDNPRLTLDRISTNGHYVPGNLRWVTRKRQAINRRPKSNTTRKNTRYIFHRGKRVHLVDFWRTYLRDKCTYDAVRGITRLHVTWTGKQLIAYYR